MMLSGATEEPINKAMTERVTFVLVSETDGSSTQAHMRQP